MTVEEIEQEREQLTLKYNLALEIRGLLDEASDKTASEDWARIEAEILQMVRRDDSPV
ncbi:hypothetical protein [Planctellipticum variicoloris]|uniref:hypothetical protein n=1 Tax=Planctellipticum variicoloris TaxID=3064265 RepID=UPI0030138F0B|nr:hypothetical protein SH412_003270 [Planctomycetaceae bacterium SH412]